ncbi:MAG: DNA adenine methylase [Deltaproteobacteria bacterium]|nr:DNA adenine methylase [Deltaproteobacteria bacterium]
MSALPLRAYAPSDDAPRPFLKWAGGKAKLVPEILARFPRRFGTYHEPFLGGGAVFFALGPRRAVLSDLNAELIATYSAIRDDVEAVIRALAVHAVSEEHFYSVRAASVAGLGNTAVAARTIFLNRTCFNGLYRVNSKGQFNVPFGRYANPKICNADNLRAVSRALQGVPIRHESVFTITPRVAAGDLVYFDPPYDPVSATSSFTAYAKTAFGKDEQVALAALCRELSERGAHVLLSNSDTPFIRELYRDCEVDTVHCRRPINARADRRGPVTEVLVRLPAGPRG